MFKTPAVSMGNTIFVRLALIYLIVIMPIIALGLYLYNWSYNNASQDLSRATTTQLAYYLEDLSREMEWMELQQYDILEDNELTRLAVTWEMMSNVERRSGLNHIRQRLTSFKNSSAFIKNVYVHVRSAHKTVSALHGVGAFNAAQYEHFRKVTAAEDQRLIWEGNTLHLSAVRLSASKEEKPLFVVQIELDREKLRHSLQQFQLYPESQSFLLSQSTGFVLLSDEKATPIYESYASELMSLGEQPEALQINGEHYHLDQAYSEKLGLSVVTYLPEATVKRPLNKFYSWAWLFAVASLAAVIIFSYSTYKYIHKPLLLLVQGFRRMEGGTLDIPIQHEQKDEFGYLFHRFNHMLRKLNSLIEQDFKQKMMMQKAELKQLQSQINPHFLYNSFFILNSLSKTGDLERIEQFTEMLGEYFRFITRNGEDFVTLQEEVHHSRMYTEIQKLRFSRRIRVQFDVVPSELASIRVPRLILQPIIENAYEHSLEKATEQGQLMITFGQDSTSLRITVENSGELSVEELERLQKLLLYPDLPDEMTGMINIHRRLQLCYAEGSGLWLSRSRLNGLRVDIVIQLQGGTKDV